MPADPGPGRARRNPAGRYGSVKLGVGGTLPLPSTYGQQKKAESFKMQRNLLVVLPCVVYAAFLLLFMFYSFFYFHTLCTVGVGSAVFFTGMLLKAESDSPFRIGATACLMGVVLGSFCGWYIHEKRVQFWYGWQYGERYGNVVPTELASAHADASVIGFEVEAYVDTAQSVSYSPLGAWDSDFCVAPITSPGFEGEIQYFAVGTNCCQRRGGMWCDGIQTEGTHSGVVVFDTGLFKSKHDHYRDAIRLATATWDLMAAKDPILVRWVRSADVDATIRETVLEAWGLAGVCILFGCAVLGGAADFGAKAIYEGEEEQ